MDKPLLTIVFFPRIIHFTLFVRYCIECHRRREPHSRDAFRTEPAQGPYQYPIYPYDKETIDGIAQPGTAHYPIARTAWAAPNPRLPQELAVHATTAQYATELPLQSRSLGEQNRRVELGNFAGDYPAGVQRLAPTELSATQERQRLQGY